MCFLQSLPLQTTDGSESNRRMGCGMRILTCSAGLRNIDHFGGERGLEEIVFASCRNSTAQ